MENARKIPAFLRANARQLPVVSAVREYWSQAAVELAAVAARFWPRTSRQSCRETLTFRAGGYGLDSSDLEILGSLKAPKWAWAETLRMFVAYDFTHYSMCREPCEQPASKESWRKLLPRMK